jgi:GDP-mannose 6-dehydrogenase
VALSRLMGANREYIEGRLPHLSDLLSNDVDEVLAHAEVCVVGCKEPAVLAALQDSVLGDRIVIDLVRLPDAEARRATEGYQGLGW